MSYYTSDYTAAEIDALLASVDYATLPEKALPHADDMILLSDSQDDGAPKKAKIANLPGGSGGSGDMLKATYDTDNDGSVDKADAIDGVSSAGNSKYYGTNSSGAAGFYDLPSGGTSFDIHALTSESMLADTDEMPFYDVSATAARKTLWSNIKSVLKTYFDTLYAAASHSHSYMPLSGGAFTGPATAQSNTSYTTAQIRNVILSTADPSGGNNGDIWIKYS